MCKIQDDIAKTSEIDIARKQKAVERSKNYTNCVIASAVTIDTIYNDTLDIPTVAKELTDSAIGVIDGNTREIEMMLMTQAQTLNALFHRILAQIANIQMVNQFNAFADISLRAQNQSRKTLAVLAELKNPRRATFIKQQNNAVNQQVNNTPIPEDFKNTEKLANELVSEVAHEKMDIRGTINPIQGNAPTEALASLYRAKDR